MVQRERGRGNSERGAGGPTPASLCFTFRVPTSALCCSHARPSHRLVSLRRRSHRGPARVARGEDRARPGEWGSGGGSDPHAAAARRASHRDRGRDGPRRGNAGAAGGAARTLPGSGRRAGAAAWGHAAHRREPALGAGPHGAGREGDAWDVGRGGGLERLQAEATAIWEEDRAMRRRIGEAGLPLLPDGAKVLTHCNAGALATGGIGTALAPIYLAHEAGRKLHVLVDETRPVLQGARLTAWELSQAGIPCTLIADAAAGSLMRLAQVDLVLVGADRIAGNGDFANKIGTYSLAVLARHHGVPLYCAAPSSTIDPSLKDGDGIPIEQRSPDEVKTVAGRRIAPAAVAALNPAFDVTPARYVTAFVTDRGLRQPPFAVD